MRTLSVPLVVAVATAAFVSMVSPAEAIPPPRQAYWTLSFDSASSPDCVTLQPYLTRSFTGEKLIRIQNRCDTTFRLEASSCKIEECFADEGSCGSVTCDGGEFDVEPRRRDSNLPDTQDGDIAKGDVTRGDVFVDADTNVRRDADDTTSDVDESGMDTASDANVGDGDAFDDRDTGRDADADTSGDVVLEDDNSVTYSVSDLGITEEEINSKRADQQPQNDPPLAG